MLRDFTSGGCFTVGVGADASSNPTSDAADCSTERVLEEGLGDVVGSVVGAGVVVLLDLSVLPPIMGRGIDWEVGGVFWLGTVLRGVALRWAMNRTLTLTARKIMH